MLGAVPAWLALAATSVAFGAGRDPLVLSSPDKPVRWSSGWQAAPGDAGEVRYTARVAATPGAKGLGVSVGIVAAEWELRAGGRTLGAGAGAPPGPAAFAVPVEAVEPDGALQIELITRRHAGASPIPRAYGAPWRVGRLSVVREQVARARAEAVVGALPGLLVIAALAGLGLYHLLLYRRRKELAAYLSVGCTALAFAAHAALTQGWGVWLARPALSWDGRTRLEPILAFCASGLVLVGLHQLTGRPGGRGRSAVLGLLGAGALGCLVPGPTGLAVAASPAQAGLALLTIAWSCVVLVQAARERRPGVGAPIVGGGLLIGLSLAGQVLPAAVPWAHLGLLALVLALAVGLARHFRRTLEDLDLRNAQLRRFNEAANRFVPAELLGLIGRDSVVDVVRGDQRQLELTVMFSDVRGFTTLAESRTPAETMDLINRYLRFIEPHVHGHEGAIGSFLGDGVMALYYGGADKAVRSAVEQIRALDDFNAEQEARGDTPIKIGIGFNTGKLMLGTVGGQDRLDCSVIGDAVNLAARIEGLTKRYGAAILVSQSTYDRLAAPEAFAMRAVDRVVVKGKTAPMALYEVVDGLPADLADRRRATLPAWDAARALYLGRDFAGARAAFQALAEGGDVAAALYAERCAHLAGVALPDDWDGSFEWTVK